MFIYFFSEKNKFILIKTQHSTNWSLNSVHNDLLIFYFFLYVHKRRNWYRFCERSKFFFERLKRKTNTNEIGCSRTVNVRNKKPNAPISTDKCVSFEIVRKKVDKCCKEYTEHGEFHFSSFLFLYMSADFRKSSKWQGKNLLMKTCILVPFFVNAKCTMKKLYNNCRV